MDDCFKNIQMVGFWFWVYHATRFSTRPKKATSQLLQSSFRTPRWCWPREGLMVLPAWGKFRWELQQETPQFSAEDSTVQRASSSNSALRWRYSIWISWINQRNHRNGKMTKYLKPTTEPSFVYISQFISALKTWQQGVALLVGDHKARPWLIFENLGF